MTTTRSGEQNRAATGKFISLVRPPMKSTLLTRNVGGHNFQTWRRMTLPALKWMNARLTP